MSRRHTLNRTRTVRPERSFRPTWQGILGVFLLLGGGYTVVDYQITIACQTKAIETVQRNIIERSGVIAEERRVDAALIRTLAQLEDDDADGKREARLKWLEANERLSAERAARPYPEPQTCR